ncbi:MAG TPA: YfhO family protein [Pyrinomonadaceae bacterium]|nr:YfhO family protein [Pyrinomonadaceae bacterium]
MRLPRKLSGVLRPRVLGAAAVTLWPVVYFYPAVLGWMSLVPYDGMLQNVPLRVAAFRMVRDGEFPLWNPYIFSGMPLHAAAQAGVLFPLNWFFLTVEPFWAGNLMTISTYALAGLGVYLYARRAGASVAGAALAGLVFESCGFMVGQLSHINVAQTAAVLPWVLWAVDGYGEGRGRRWGVLAAAFVALQAFAGHPQAFAYSLLTVGAYALASAAAHEGGGRRRYLSALVLSAAGVMLAAVQILPTLELLRNSLRSSATYDFFTSFSLPPEFALTFVAPYVLGGGDGHVFAAPYTGPPFYTEYVGYVGAAGLALAAASLALRRDARTWFWAALAVAGFALALGRNLPLDAYKLVYYVPGLNLFRVPARHLLEVDLALAVLAGRGLTALREAPDRARAVRVALATGLGVFALACLAVTAVRPAELKLAGGSAATLTSAPELFIPVVAAGLSAAALWLCARRAGRWAAAPLFVVVALDLALFGHATGWRGASLRPDHQLWRTPPPLSFVRKLEESAGRETGRYRILTAHHPFDPGRTTLGPMTTRSTDWIFWLQPDIYMMRGAENAAGYEAFGLARYSRLAGDMKVWGELTDPDATLRGPGRELDLLNVRYLLAMGTGPPATDSTTAETANAATAATDDDVPAATNDDATAATDDHAPAADGATAETGGGPAAGGGTATAARPGAARWRYAGTTSGVVIYENTRALPRAWVAPETLALHSEAALNVIRTGRLPAGAEWDPLRTALVAGRVGTTTQAITPQAPASPEVSAELAAGEASRRAAGASEGAPDHGARVVRHGPHRVEVKTSSRAPGVLVVAENHYPGWRAYLDGRAVPLLRVNYNQRGVRLPAGEHEVVFVYRPWSFYGGLIVTALTGLALLLWARGGLAALHGSALQRARAYLSSRKR